MPHTLPLPLQEPASSTPPPAVPEEVTRSHATRAWAAIHLSALPLEALGVSEVSTEAVAVVESPSPKALVLALSAGARSVGIDAGMTAAEACARAGHLQLKLRDTMRETATLNRLAAWSKCFTSAVSLEPPEVLLLDIGGSLKLFGGRKVLQARIQEGLGTQGYTANVALAPTPRAALWLARAGFEERWSQTDQIASALGKLPVSTLSLSARNTRRFSRIGVRTLKQAFRLPREGLAQRFGPQLLRDWDRALGQTPEPRSRWKAESRFAAGRELPGACRDLGQMEPLIDDLVTKLVTKLGRHDAGIDTLTLLFGHVDQSMTRLVLNLLTTSRDSGRIKRLLHTRLEQFVLPAPAISIRLTSSVFKTIAPEYAPGLPTLFEQTVPSPSSDTLVETLCTRLGRQAVLELASVADHRPEYAWQKIVPGCSSAVTPSTIIDTPASGTDAPRPFWLLAAPQPLRERKEQPLYRGKTLQLQRPPERIEGGWWEADDMSRDYYQAQACDGAWLWVYREQRGARGWFLHGYFA